MTKIAKSLAMIALVAAVAVGATSSFFSDKETSVGNTFTAGTIDISVDGQNPWNTSWSNYLDKPCQTNYMTFTIKNEGENPANVWKRIMNIETNGGVSSYPPSGALYVSGATEGSIASSEPEYTEGGGTVTYDDGVPTFDNTNYVEEHNLASYMVYDMAICKKMELVGGELVSNNDACPFEDDEFGNADKKPSLGTNTDWDVIIPEANEVRIDNIGGIWIKLDDVLWPGEELIVVQSYHLMAWKDASVESITNWAQGDVMTFDIELEARQIDAPAPGTEEIATLNLLEKNTGTWVPVEGGANGTLTYYTSGPTFKYSFSANGLKTDENYSLIYYPDPWGSSVIVLSDPMVPATGFIGVSSQEVELSSDLPMSGDTNAVGAKIWLVPSIKLGSSVQGSSTTLSYSDTGKFLFEKNMITYTEIN